MMFVAIFDSRLYAGERNPSTSRARVYAGSVTGPPHHANVPGQGKAVVQKVS